MAVPDHPILFSQKLCACLYQVCQMKPDFIHPQGFSDKTELAKVGACRSFYRANQARQPIGKKRVRYLHVGGLYATFKTGTCQNVPFRLENAAAQWVFKGQVPATVFGAPNFRPVFFWLTRLDDVFPRGFFLSEP